MCQPIKKDSKYEYLIMKRLALVVVTVLLVAGFISCTSSKEKEIKRIKAYESELLNDKTGIHKEKADTLLNMYDRFAKDYPSDSLVPHFMFKAGDLAMNMNEPQRAISYFDIICNSYKNFNRMPDCIFLKGFIYENYLDDLEKAKSHYQEFIQKYPNHELTSSAQGALDNLGLSPDDIVKKFQEKNAGNIKTDTVRS